MLFAWLSWLFLFHYLLKLWCMCVFFLFRFKKVKNTAYVQAITCSMESTDVYWILIFSFKLPFHFLFLAVIHSKNKLLTSFLVHTRLWTICITEMFKKDSWKINIKWTEFLDQCKQVGNKKRKRQKMWFLKLCRTGFKMLRQGPCCYS